MLLLVFWFPPIPLQMVRLMTHWSAWKLSYIVTWGVKMSTQDSGSSIGKVFSYTFPERWKFSIIRDLSWYFLWDGLTTTIFFSLLQNTWWEDCGQSRIASGRAFLSIPLQAGHNTGQSLCFHKIEMERHKRNGYRLTIPDLVPKTEPCKEWKFSLSSSISSKRGKSDPVLFHDPRHQHTSLATWRELVEGEAGQCGEMAC